MNKIIQISARQCGKTYSEEDKDECPCGCGRTIQDLLDPEYYDYGDLDYD